MLQAYLLEVTKVLQYLRSRVYLFLFLAHRHPSRRAVSRILRGCIYCYGTVVLVPDYLGSKPLSKHLKKADKR